MSTISVYLHSNRVHYYHTVYVGCMLMVDLGMRLKDLRKKHNLTQQQVADRVWVSKSMVSSYELGTRSPSYEVLIKLSRLFGVTTDYLLGVDKAKTIDASKLSDKQIGIIITLIEEMTKNQDA